jgi:glycosyltransferase involved in cell wall biosynthesis
MRVLDIHQFFAGPSSPGPDQPRAVVRALADRGHEVDVIACDFNAYSEQTEVAEEWRSEAGGIVRIHRLPAPRNMRAGLRRRLSTYVRFAWSAWRFGSRLQRPDVVLSSIQPLFAGYAGLRLARRWGVPMLLEVRDLWPDALVAKQAISRIQAAPLERLARALYFGADRVVSLTPGIRRELVAKGLRADRIDLLPNGFKERSTTDRASDREAIRREFGWGDQFVAVFTGAHTEVTAVEVMVLAAECLKDRPDIRIDLFGAGQTKAAAQALAASRGLGNVHFHDAVPKSQVARILAGADVALMTLFKSPLIHIYFESKLIDYLGAGKPILAAMDGLQPDVIASAGAGHCVGSFDHEGLARLIRAAADDRAPLAAMGASGASFVRRHLAQPVILSRYVDTIEAVAARGAESLEAWDPLGIA